MRKYANKYACACIIQHVDCTLPIHRTLSAYDIAACARHTWLPSYVYCFEPNLTAAMTGRRRSIAQLYVRWWRLAEACVTVSRRNQDLTQAGK